VTSPSEPAPPPAEPARPRSVTPVPLARRTTKPRPPAPFGQPAGPEPAPVVPEPAPPRPDIPAQSAPPPATVPPPAAAQPPAAVPPAATPPAAAGPAPLAEAAASATAPPVDTARKAEPVAGKPYSAEAAAGAAPQAETAPPVAPPVEAAAGAASPPADAEAAASTTAPSDAAPSTTAEDPPGAEPATTQPSSPISGIYPDPPSAKPAATTAEPATTPAGPTPAGPAPDLEKKAASNGAPAGGLTQLTAALVGLRHTLATTRFTLRLPEAKVATATATATIAQLDDYLLPRLRRLDAPLLVVVGGSTGAGKSTLVNSLVRAPVSPAGVLRPTTRAPVLVCNPADSPWFAENHLLPGLARTSSPSTDPGSLQLVTADYLTAGLAYLDAPDIDSVVDSNRALATQLLAAADLWLFVTTAARYADAVPWALLHTAQQRGTVVALVLDRVPTGAADEIGPHLTQMLRDNSLGSAPLFVLPEAHLDSQGLLTERVITPLRGWFDQLASSASARAAVVRQTVGGAIDALGSTVDGLAVAADEQVAADQVLADAVRTAYTAAVQSVADGMRDGVLLRGEVLSRWQELVGTGDLMRALQARVGRARDRVIAAFTGRPAPGKQFQAALESGVVTLIRGAAADAAEQVGTAWRAHPAGAPLVTDALQRPSPELAERAERLVRDWQRGILELVRQEATGKLKLAKVSAYAVNATGLLVMVSVFTATAFIPTGLEVATAAGTTVAAQKVLEAIFGDQAVRTLAEQARNDLLARVQAILAAEAERYDAARAATGVDPQTAARLREAARTVTAARRAVELPDGALPRPGLVKTAGQNGG
jgi:hypothetical protein